MENAAICLPETFSYFSSPLHTFPPARSHLHYLDGCCGGKDGASLLHGREEVL